MHWFDELARDSAETRRGLIASRARPLARRLPGPPERLPLTGGRIDRRTSLKFAGAAALALGPLRALMQVPQARASEDCERKCIRDVGTAWERRLGKCRDVRNAKRKHRPANAPAGWFDKERSEFLRCVDEAWAKVNPGWDRCTRPHCGDPKRYPPPVVGPVPGPSPLPPLPPPPKDCPQGWGHCSDGSCVPPGYTCCGNGGVCTPGRNCCQKSGLYYCQMSPCPG
jgi:hypothetical protein